MTRHPVRARAVALPLAAAVSLLLAALPLAAQQAPPERADLAGRVVDARTGAPVSQALVRVPELHREAVTDSAGRFVIARIPAREHRVQVTRLGYAATTQPVLAAAGSPAEIPLVAQPLVLERVDVISEVFRLRRMHIPYGVHTIGREELLRTRMYSARNLLPMAGVHLGHCSARGGLCISSRGRFMRPSVSIDDRPAVGGVEELDMYDPQDLYLVEVIRGGAVISVYTADYVERLARSGRTPAELMML